jgi:hypothetical protein
VLDETPGAVGKAIDRRRKTTSRWTERKRLRK